MPPKPKPDKRFPAADSLVLHLVNLYYYRGAISCAEHILKTGANSDNVEKTLEVYRMLLQNEDPKGER